MVAISERCARPPGPDQLAMYYRFLSPRLTTEEFHEVAMSVWSSAEFFPPPVRFLEARSGREWDRVVELVRDYTPPNVRAGWSDDWQALSEESRLAVQRLGGPLAFKEQSYNRDAVRAYDQFTKAYSVALQDSAAADAALEYQERPLLQSGGAG